MDIYTSTKTNITIEILAHKTIHYFREFVYSVNKTHRPKIFGLVNRLLQNEVDHGLQPEDEKVKIRTAINYWKYENFEHDPTWWYLLSSNHWHCVLLIDSMQMWLNDTPKLTTLTDIDDARSVHSKSSDFR